MRQFIAPTEDFVKVARTALSADAAKGATTINVVNATNLVAQDFICIGYEGSNNAELVKITSINGMAITLPALVRAHKADEPVTKYRYDKRKFYGSLTQNGSYTELTSYGSPSLINVNNPQGTLFEYSGTEGYLWFKSTYYNSVGAQETDQADSSAVQIDQSGRYCTLYAIRNQAGLTNNPYITDATIEDYRKQAENEVDSYLSAKYVLPLANSTNVAEIPFLVTRIATLLAAGYWDYKEFGSEGEGKKWLGEGRAILKNLQGPGGQQLMGSDRKPMQTVTTAMSVQGFPDQVDNKNGPAQVFTMKQRF